MTECIDLPVQPTDSYADVAGYAQAVSLANPGLYVTVQQGFGPCYAVLAKRLGRHAPGDTVRELRCYWLNGKRREFTTAQRVAYQQIGDR